MLSKLYPLLQWNILVILQCFYAFTKELRLIFYTHKNKLKKKISSTEFFLSLTHEENYLKKEIGGWWLIISLHQNLALIKLISHQVSIKR